MFPPRAIQLQRAKAPAKRPAPEEYSASPPDAPPATKKPRTVPPPDPPPPVVYFERLVRGVELIMSDYAYLEPTRQVELQKHERTYEGVPGYIHLSALLNHPILNRGGFSPAPTQPLLLHALAAHPSALLDPVPDAHFVRRRPGSFIFLPPSSPPPTQPPQATGKKKSKNKKRGPSGLPLDPSAAWSAAWDKRTVYVEPHEMTLAGKPAHLVHHLHAHFRQQQQQERLGRAQASEGESDGHGHADRLADPQESAHEDAASPIPAAPSSRHGNLLPVQDVRAPRPRYAFVTLSGDVDMLWARDGGNGGGGEKWRRLWPPDWIVLPLAEWRRRTEEYRALIAGMQEQEQGKEGKDGVGEPDTMKKGRRKNRRKGKKGAGRVGVDVDVDADGEGKGEAEAGEVKGGEVVVEEVAG